ncbi:Sodium/glutamate symporter [Fusobacterium sp. DD29]|uniref:sodium/glutamate symporter n=1 Tax=unclassified Fusobacterium TaxID=2648384 RepID=UPI001B8B8EAD|nr:MULTISPECIES: sodium/glutamate symporter [unclassified Fusobacterium]MBR8700566.1 Sodium/glutamate symporter [Fusobacterium sp. DD45]MBR8710315.1 Sodium/glutamate symporter [Fusobacterium sp. DD28]MBR8749287.1 Sodium/glutamate symporter [Fusobacterium sp. DD29]MBR8750799.1 Sodium/glutamate symporter [Fusobacterium sp. DD26]MBR8761553.1 Sodium/glutamate symporter [Fusobacterium sp. DD25]
MFEYSFNMAETLAIAVVILLLGRWIKRKVSVLEKFFIPAPVIGGVLFSLLLLIGHSTGTFAFEFDAVLKNFLMIIFFTTIGFSASFELLKKGGIGVILFLICATILVILQDVVGVYLAKFFGLHPFIGLAAGSVPLTGGHGTSGAFGPVLEKAGATGAFSVAIACATFGLVAGCLIGGPIGRRLLTKYNLKPKEIENPENKDIIDMEKQLPVSEKTLFDGVVVIAISMGIGVYIPLLAQKYGLTLPPYIGSMLIAAVIRNIADKRRVILPMKEISIIGNISLSLFLAMALMSLKLWQLAELALPLIVILIVQTVMMGLFAYFVTFNVMGRDYDACVLATGHCGFGLGATPNAMANMEAFASSTGFSAKAFFILPLVGSLFIDFVNATIITFFMNIFG